MATRAIDFQLPYTRKQIAIGIAIGAAFLGLVGAGMAWQAHREAEKWRLWNESGDEALLRNIAAITPPGTKLYKTLSNGQLTEIKVDYDRGRHGVCAVAYLPAKPKGPPPEVRGCVPDPQ